MSMTLMMRGPQPATSCTPAPGDSAPRTGITCAGPPTKRGRLVLWTGAAQRYFVQHNRIAREAAP